MGVPVMPNGLNALAMTIKVFATISGNTAAFLKRFSDAAMDTHLDLATASLKRFSDAAVDIHLIFVTRPDISASRFLYAILRLPQT